MATMPLEKQHAKYGSHASDLVTTASTKNYGLVGHLNDCRSKPIWNHTKDAQPNATMQKWVFYVNHSRERQWVDADALAQSVKPDVHSGKVIEMVYLTEMYKITILQMIGYGDRTRTQAEVVRLFQEKYPELPPITQAGEIWRVKSILHYEFIYYEWRRGIEQSSTTSGANGMAQRERSRRKHQQQKGISDLPNRWAK
ncbi:hypothetical protein NQ318_013461, partial [Aromia moschata]